MSEPLDRISIVSEYIDRLYPNISRSMKEELAKEMLNTVSDTGFHNLGYAMNQDDGLVDPPQS